MSSHVLNWLSELASVTWFSLMSIPQRLGSVSASVFGICGVVTVFVGVLSIAQGFRHALTVTATPGSVIVMRTGSDSEMMSLLPYEEVRIIMDAPGIRQGPDGPLASPELSVIINLPKRSTGTDANVPLRGVRETAARVRDGFQLVEGRFFEPGRNEIIVGVSALREYSNLTLGSSLRVGRNDWIVVGIFAANGGMCESEIWADAVVLQGAYQRGTTFQSVSLRLESESEFERLKSALETDPRLSVKALLQSEYFEGQSRMIFNLITGLGTLIAGLMGIGAVFGALNTMYAAVSARTREIATLRALGFGSSPVVVSILIESLLLALAGGATGGVLAFVAFDGYQAATMNWQSFSQVAFAFKVTPMLLIQGTFCASIIGLIGGIFPAIRAARLPIAKGLREL